MAAAGEQRRQAVQAARRDSLLKDTDDPDLKRRSKASANRIRAVFFAARNLAYEHGCVQSRDPWQRVKPFKNVDEARKRSLTVEEAIKVINACDRDFRSLVRGSLYTGLRLGELIALRTADVNAREDFATLSRWPKIIPSEFRSVGSVGLYRSQSCDSRCGHQV